MLSQVRPPCSPVYGEALAAQLVGVLATSLILDKFILEGNSSIVVSALQNPTLVIDWHIEHMINDTISSFPASSLWEVRKINRSVEPIMWYIGPRKEFSWAPFSS